MYVRYPAMPIPMTDRTSSVRCRTRSLIGSSLLREQSVDRSGDRLVREAVVGVDDLHLAARRADDERRRALQAVALPLGLLVRQASLALRVAHLGERSVDVEASDPAADLSQELVGDVARVLLTL